MVRSWEPLHLPLSLLPGALPYLLPQYSCHPAIKGPCSSPWARSALVGQCKAVFVFWYFGFFCLFVLLFRASPMAYGNFQARDPNRAAPAGLCHSHQEDPSPDCNLHHNSGQRWVLNPMSKARDQPGILMDTCQIHFHCATKGTPQTVLLLNIFTATPGNGHTLILCCSQLHSGPHSLPGRVQNLSSEEAALQALRNSSPAPSFPFLPQRLPTERGESWVS